MHRSGTSALTRALSLAGLALPPDTGRVWESRTIIGIDSRILARFGLDWFEPGEIPTERLVGPELADLRREAVAALGTLFGPNGPFVVKEPRMARLVPFWDLALREFGAEPRYVLAVRSPPDVASSLAARNDMDAATALTLWTDHVAAAERDTRGRPRAVSDYGLLLRDKSREIERLVAALDLPLPALGEAERASIDAFVTDDGEHVRANPDEFLSTAVASAAAAVLYARMVGDSASADAVRGLGEHLERCAAIPPSAPLRTGEARERAEHRPLRTGRRQRRDGSERPAPGKKRRGAGSVPSGRGRLADLMAHMGRLFGFGRKSR
jgi:hypothetical protein